MANVTYATILAVKNSCGRLQQTSLLNECEIHWGCLSRKVANCAYYVPNIKHRGLGRFTLLSRMSLENGKEIVDSGQARLAALGKLPVLHQTCLFLRFRSSGFMS